MNMGQVIKAHNAQIMRDLNTQRPERTCNCRQKDTCPLRGNCLASDIVYKATVNSGIDSVTYIGLASGHFKSRFNNHNKSFNHERYEKDTELSKHIWNLKRQNTDFAIKWDIICQSNTKRRHRSDLCNLCIEEKLAITLFNGSQLLNKRSELVSKCRHGNCTIRRAPNRAKKKP